MSNKKLIQLKNLGPASVKMLKGAGNDSFHKQQDNPDTPVIQLKNIGTTLAKRLATINIHTRYDLQSFGVTNAYIKMQETSPFVLPVCYNLYSLEGALRSQHWNDLPEAIKDELYQTVKGCER